MAELSNRSSMKMKRKNNGLQMDWDMVLDDTSDDHMELVITSSEKSKCGGEEDGYFKRKTDFELEDTISKHRSYILNLGHKMKDKGEKLKATVRRCEMELNRRKKMRGDKNGLKHQEAIQLSDHSDDDASCRKDQKFSVLSSFGKIFSKKIDENARTGNAFGNRSDFIDPRQGRKSDQNGQRLMGLRSSQQSSSRSNQFQCPTTRANNKKNKISNSDKKVIRSDTSSLDRFLTKRRPSFLEMSRRTPAVYQDQPVTELKPKFPSSYHLVDEDIEEPCVSNTTPCAEKLSDCMKDVKVYFPSRDDRDRVEVWYTDMDCLAPEACLSSNIMNFYVRYLQQPSSENRMCNYHFFNTYFYNKLQKLNSREDSFLKFRKWWKGVNIFEKAYILLPIHQSAHWSLGIICIPTKEDELGPIILHLDSLGLHNSGTIFDNIRRFVKEEWKYLRSSEDSLDLPITDELWKNLDLKIIQRKVEVPQQKNGYDCGLFVLYYMERFIKEAPERLTEKDLSMFWEKWFLPEEASNLRVRIRNLLVQEFKIAKDKETVSSPTC